MTGTNLQGTNIISMIVPTNHADTYATHDSFYGKGGWREVETLDARNNIPEERRRIGMVVYVRETFKAYLLKNSLSNAGWVPFNIDGEDYVTKEEMDTAIAEALENYTTRADVQEILDNGNYATQEWVENYISEIGLSEYQKKVDNNLQTSDKTIVGAINELNSKPHIDTYTKEEADALLALKSDKETTYTKVETDELLEGKANVGDSYTKAESDAKYLIEHQDISGKVDKEISSATGKALIFNEADGGGAKFEGITRDSFAGVNNMSAPNNVGVQLYNIDKSTKVGPRINLTSERATYSIDKTEVTADYEILIKKDLNNYYNKQEVDKIIEDLPIATNVYTKEETDALLSAKADNTTVTAIDNRVTAIEEGDVFVPTEEYEAKCAQYEAEIAALQEENTELQNKVAAMNTTLEYVYTIVTTPHYDILPDELRR